MKEGAWDRAGRQIDDGITRDMVRLVELFQVWEWAATHGVRVRNVPDNITEASILLDGEWHTDTVREWGPWLAEEGHMLFGAAAVSVRGGEG